MYYAEREKYVSVVINDVCLQMMYCSLSYS